MENLNNGNTLYMISKEDLQTICEMVCCRMIEDRLKADKDEPEEEQYLTREEVCKMLSVTKTTLYRWDKANYLVPKKVGRRVLYLKSDVSKLMTA